MDLPDKSLVEHQETETSVANKGAGPSVVGTMNMLVDLIQVVSSAHPPFPEIILEDVVAVSELAWVALSLAGLSTTGSMNISPVVDINVVKTLRGLEAEIVVARGSSLAETSALSSDNPCCLLFDYLDEQH